MESNLTNFSIENTSFLASNCKGLNLKSILNQFINYGNRLELDYILSVIKQKQAEKDFIKMFLDELKTNVDILDQKIFENTLIQLIFFDIRWHENYSDDQIILTSLSDFLIDLNIAYTGYNYKCLGMLLKNFSLVNSQGPGESEFLSETRHQTLTKTINCQAMYDFSHNIINHLIKIIPSCKVHIPKLFENLFPYMSKETLIQEAFVKNLLIVAENISDLRLILLEICIQKLLIIDVNCQREQIISAESNEEFSSSNSQNITSMSHILASKLDSMMLCLFEFIQKNCIKDSFLLMKENNEILKFNWEFCKSIYKDILFCFDKYILTTYGSSHVQFVIFYICSFRSMLSEGFLDYLWKKFISVNTSSVSKAICCYYLGSFLARLNCFTLIFFNHY